jgi:hypothetical protein
VAETSVLIIPHYPGLGALGATAQARAAGNISARAA